jgi:hypothetical protein
MAAELTGIALGGAIGLVGGLGGVLIGQVMTSRREARRQKLEGLESVIQELNKLGRLSLQIAQYINPLVGKSAPHEIAKTVFNAPGWKECTHELQERSWHFPCLAYLPEAFNDFVQLEKLISIIMDPFCEAPADPSETSRDQAALAFNQLYRSISEKVEVRLKALS